MPLLSGLPAASLGDFFGGGGRGNSFEIFCCNNFTSEPALTAELQKFQGRCPGRVAPGVQEGVESAREAPDLRAQLIR